MTQQNTQPKRTKFVAVRMTEEEMQQLRKQAYQQQISLGSVMRNAFIATYGKDCKACGDNV